MNQAWKLSFEGQGKFGGKVSEYIAESMKIVWNTIKKGVGIMEEMKGTEKQVKWANDIRERVITLQDWVMENTKDVKTSKKRPEAKEIVINEMNEVLNNNDAKFWIDNFQNIRGTNDIGYLYDYTRGMSNVIELNHYSQRNVFVDIVEKASFKWMEMDIEQAKKRS